METIAFYEYIEEFIRNSTDINDGIATQGDRSLVVGDCGISLRKTKEIGAGYENVFVVFKSKLDAEVIKRIQRTILARHIELNNDLIVSFFEPPEVS